MTNEDYKELYNSAIIGLWRTSIDDGKFISANSAVAHIFGYDDVDDLVTDKFCNLKELKDPQKNENFEVCLEKKDGSPVWVSISAKIYPEKDYIEGSIRDITEQKKHEINLVPHLQKLSSLKQNIINRLKQEDAFHQSKSVKTA